MPDDDYEDEEPNEDSNVKLKSLRDRANRTDAAEAEADSLRTKVALLEAGLGDLTERQRKAILATHDGDLTADALKSAASDLGFLTEDEPDPVTPQIPAWEQAAHERVAAATAGGEPAEARGPLSQEDRIKAIRGTAGSLEEADALLADEGIFLNP